MENYNELLSLRQEGQLEEKLKKQAELEQKIHEWEQHCKDVMKKLDGRLKAAAKKGYLELKLIEVELPNLASMNKIYAYDKTRKSTLGGGWRTVNPYQDKSVLKNLYLIELWEMLEFRGLRPIFIEGPFGKPIFGVQLPDGGEYPRDDKVADVAWRTMSRMDFYLNEDGTINFPTPKPTIHSLRHTG